MPNSPPNACSECMTDKAFLDVAAVHSPGFSRVPSTPLYQPYYVSFILWTFHDLSHHQAFPQSFLIFPIKSLLPKLSWVCFFSLQLSHLWPLTFWLGVSMAMIWMENELEARWNLVTIWVTLGNLVFWRRQ